MSRATDCALIGALVCVTLRASDGRGWWRLQAAVAADMQAAGTAPSIVANTTAAAVAVGQHLRRLIVAAGFKP